MRLLTTKSHITLILFLILVVGRVDAQYPTIGTLDSSDALFQQQQADVKIFYARSGSGDPLPPLLLYQYAPTPTDTLFGIAARLSVPYSALATLNRLTEVSLDTVESMLLPGIPGVFVPLHPVNDLEYLMRDLRDDQDPVVVSVASSQGATLFRFYPGQDFLPDERRAFLGLLFRNPVENAEVTSRYGPRIHPVSGVWAFHHGLDLGATRGAPVVAARNGTVAETGFDDVMGNYVLVDHDGGFQTFYGHLETVLVALNQELGSGMILGTVGDTGSTTGSHLHFEIRHNGDTRDPLTLLP